MIIKEKIIVDELEYQKTYSDLGVYIENNGNYYVSAIDPQGYYDREYTETDKIIKPTNKKYSFYSFFDIKENEKENDI